MAGMKDKDDFKRMLDDMAAQVDSAVAANAFIGMHVVYQQMREAGFTMTEACTVIGVWIANQANG